MLEFYGMLGFDVTSISFSIAGTKTEIKAEKIIKKFHILVSEKSVI